MNQEDTRRSRWPKEARDLVKQYLEHDRIQERRCSVRTERDYRPWTIAEQQRLLDLIVANPPAEVAKMLNRSTGSVRTKLRRLGASAQMGREWFTKRTLAEALHISVAKIQQWIDRGWLKTRIVETGKLRKEVISPDEFTELCKEHREAIIGPRLNVDRLEFVRLFVFPPSHKELLPVRESKKEREAYQEQAKASSESRIL